MSVSSSIRARYSEKARSSSASCTGVIQADLVPTCVRVSRGRRQPATGWSGTASGGPTGVRRGVVRIGVSGWTYRAWRGDFYPSGLVQRRELAYMAGRLTSIEVNGSFYSLQRPSSWERWRAEVPEGSCSR